jgi:FkbM family methyltransferase
MLIPFQDLFRRHQIRACGVVHLGANKGQEAEAYAAQGIQKVIWVEALPQVFQELWIKMLSYPEHQLFQACLSDKNDEKVTFHVASNEGQSSSMFEFGTHAKEHPTVKYVDEIAMETVRLDTLFAENEVKLEGDSWFLNIDLQGAELHALRGMGTLLNHFRYAYIEVNEKGLYKGCPLVGEIDSFLASFGFVGKEVKMTGSGWGDKFYLKG